MAKFGAGCPGGGCRRAQRGAGGCEEGVGQRPGCARGQQHMGRRFSCWSITSGDPEHLRHATPGCYTTAHTHPELLQVFKRFLTPTLSSTVPLASSGDFSLLALLGAQTQMAAPIPGPPWPHPAQDMSHAAQHQPISPSFMSRSQGKERKMCQGNSAWGGTQPSASLVVSSSWVQDPSTTPGVQWWHLTSPHLSPSHTALHGASLPKTSPVSRGAKASLTQQPQDPVPAVLGKPRHSLNPPLHGPEHPPDI